MKKIFLLLPIFLLAACNLADVENAHTRMPPQRVLNKCDMLKMEQLNSGYKEPVLYQTTKKQPSPGTPY